VPTSSAYIYDFDRLEREEIDLENNLLWYRISSLESVVFFKWVPVSPANSPSDREPEEAEDEELFTIQPCNYRTSLVFYRGLMSIQAREDLQARFMDQLGVTDTEQSVEEEEMQSFELDSDWFGNGQGLSTNRHLLSTTNAPDVSEDDFDSDDSDAETFKVRSTPSINHPIPF
jgi:hypothetical protein